MNKMWFTNYKRYVINDFKTKKNKKIKNSSVNYEK